MPREAPVTRAVFLRACSSPGFLTIGHSRRVAFRHQSDSIKDKSRTLSEWAIGWADLPKLFMVGTISLSLNVRNFLGRQLDKLASPPGEQQKCVASSRADLLVDTQAPKP